MEIGECKWVRMQSSNKRVAVQFTSIIHYLSSTLLNLFAMFYQYTNTNYVD